MATLQNMIRKQQDLQDQFDLLSEKIGRLRKAFIIETDPSVKFKLEKQLEDAETEREQLEQQLDSLERDIQAHTASTIPQRSSNNLQQISDQIGRIEKQEIAATLHNRIVDVLTSLPNIQDKNERRALIYSAGLDQELENQLEFDGSTLQFCQLLVKTLGKYGILKDGRSALIAILEAAKNRVGQDKKEVCEVLIQKLLPAPSQKPLSKLAQSLLEEIKQDTRYELQGITILYSFSGGGFYFPYLWWNSEKIDPLRRSFAEMKKIDNAIQEIVERHILREYYRGTKFALYILWESAKPIIESLANSLLEKIRQDPHVDRPKGFTIFPINERKTEGGSIPYLDQHNEFKKIDTDNIIGICLAAELLEEQGYLERMRESGTRIRYLLVESDK